MEDINEYLGAPRFNKLKCGPSYCFRSKGVIQKGQSNQLANEGNVQ